MLPFFNSLPTLCNPLPAGLAVIYPAWNNLPSLLCKLSAAITFTPFWFAHQAKLSGAGTFFPFSYFNGAAAFMSLNSENHLLPKTG